MLRRVVTAVIVAVIAFGFVELGFWQLRRHTYFQAIKTSIESRSGLPPAPIQGLLTPGFSPSMLEFRNVALTGRYDPAREIILADHPLDGVAGNHIVTPVRLDDGKAVLVDRGWIPLEDTTPPVADATPPSGTVTITAILMQTEHRGSLGPRLPATGTLAQVFRIEIPRLQQQMPYELYPMWVLLRSQQPAQLRPLPKIAPAPSPTSSPPNLLYATQWFLFAAIGVFGYVFLLRKELRAPPVAAPAEADRAPIA
ncbi:MAG: SURF1 family protein [Actinomycetota bacterium]|nr:SURF1 family protein [Actinomycetota bacterium]